MGSPECEFGRNWFIAGSTFLKVRFGLCRAAQENSGDVSRLKICLVRLDRHEFIFRLSDSYTRCSEIM